MKAYVNRMDNVKIKTLIIVLTIFYTAGKCSFVVSLRQNHDSVCFQFLGYPKSCDHKKQVFLKYGESSSPSQKKKKVS